MFQEASYVFEDDDDDDDNNLFICITQLLTDNVIKKRPKGQLQMDVTQLKKNNKIKSNDMLS